jgi:hypothetical protein
MGEIILHSEQDFTDVHRDLQEFIRTYPANAGVSRGIIYDHMRKKNISRRSINIALRELVGGGFVIQLSFSHYAVRNGHN